MVPIGAVDITGRADEQYGHIFHQFERLQEGETQIVCLGERKYLVSVATENDAERINKGFFCFG